MLGSVEDAEEAVQDALLRAWRSREGFAGRSTLRTWLYTIASNVCLTRLGRRRGRVLPVELGPASDPAHTTWHAVDGGWVEPLPDALVSADGLRDDPAARYEAREAVELAFIAALQHLLPRPRAVLVLRDVVGLSAKETAGALSTTVASVTSALQRARRAVADVMPPSSQQVALASLGDIGLRRTVERYVAAWERGDLDAIVALLTDDVEIAMPPYPVWYAGRDDIAAFLALGPLRERWRMRPVGVNGQLSFAGYAWRPPLRRFTAHSLDVVRLRGGRICSITAFLELDPAAFRRLGLPGSLPT